MSVALRWGSATDVGMVRESNQDAMLVADPLFAVADGMGGANGGEVASATALDILSSTFADGTHPDDLLEAVRRANAKVWDKAQLNDNLRGMGTTLTVLAKIEDEEGERIAIANVGDSRAYLLRDGELTQVTTDHSLVEEMVRAGEISPEEAEIHPRRNILTRALGVEPTVQADIDFVVPVPGDRFLLCSDGLVREVGDNQVGAVLRRLRNPDEACKELVGMAKAAGGHDNITIVIVDVEADEAEPVQVAAPADVSKGRSKRKGKKKSKEPQPRTGGPLTFRMVLFFLTALTLLGLGVGSVFWYARASYFVRADGNDLVIYQGRPEKVLWFEPTLSERTGKTLDDVLPAQHQRLRNGQPQASLDQARRYITNLTTEAQTARGLAASDTTPSPSPSPTSTVPGGAPQ